MLNAKKIARQILAQLKKNIARSKTQPGLAVILVGHNKASELYISLKEKAAQEVGIYFKKYLLPEKTSQKKLITLIEKLNGEKKIHGIIVQLPLPKHLNTDFIISIINPQKDADGFHQKNLADLENSSGLVWPVLVQVIVKFLQITEQNLQNKTACLVANSTTFFKPFQFILPNEFGLKVVATKASNRQLKNKTKKADVLVVAMGKPLFITKDYIKKGAIVIDVGITKKGKKILGDVNFKSCKNKASFITPVPGGVGPLTVAFLLKNVYLLSKIKKQQF